MIIIYFSITFAGLTPVAVFDSAALWAYVRPMSYLFYMILIGLFTGMMTGLTGASGVAIVVPLLNLLLGFSVHESIGTSLLVDVIASVAVAWTYFRAGNIDFASGLWVAVGSIFGAQVGALWAVGVSAGGLQIGFGLCGIIMGIMLWRRGLKSVPERQPMAGRKRYPIALLLGFGVGIITGLIGAGGGIMIMLVLLFVLGMPIHIAIGTSTLMMTLTAISGTLAYGFHGNLNLEAGIVIGLSAVVGGVICATYANRVNAKLLSRIVSVIFVGLGLVMAGIGLSA